MSVKVIILTKSREAIIKEARVKSGYYKMKDGLYVLATEAIANCSINGKVSGAECYFFEGNPNPLSYQGITDKSDTFMNDFILVNALEQTSHSPSVSLDRIGEIFSSVGSYFKSPSNVVWFLFYGVIAYAIIKELIGGVLG